MRMKCLPSIDRSLRGAVPNSTARPNHHWTFHRWKSHERLTVQCWQYRRSIRFFAAMSKRNCTCQPKQIRNQPLQVCIFGLFLLYILQQFVSTLRNVFGKRFDSSKSKNQLASSRIHRNKKNGTGEKKTGIPKQNHILINKKIHKY